MSSTDRSVALSNPIAVASRASISGQTQYSAGGGGGSFVNPLLTSTNITQASTAGNGSAEIVAPIGNPTTFNTLGQVQTYMTPADGSYVLATYS